VLQSEKLVIFVARCLLCRCAALFHVWCVGLC
jgi:hypothetical protein